MNRFINQSPNLRASIDLIQLILFSISKYFFIDMVMYIFQTIIYVKIWNEIKN